MARGRRSRKRATHAARRTQSLPPAAVAAFVKNAWVQLALSGIAVIGLVVTVVAAWPRPLPVVVPEPVADPEIAVCEDLDLDRSQYPSLPDSVAGLEELRAIAAARVAQASPGSDLHAVLVDRLEVIDVAIAVGTADVLDAERNVAVYVALLDTEARISEACRARGVELFGSSGPETADGSISHEDALVYCSSMLELLRHAAVADTDDDHLWALTRVVTNRMFDGLPPEVYGATSGIITMLVLAAIAGEGYPEAEADASLVAGYCTDLGSPGWPEPRLDR